MTNVFDDKVTTSLLDRLLRHCHLVKNDTTHGALTTATRPLLPQAEGRCSTQEWSKPNPNRWDIHGHRRPRVAFRGDAVLDEPSGIIRRERRPRDVSHRGLIRHLRLTTRHRRMK